MTRAELVIFVEGLLGARWKLGAQGPEAYDCWSLLCHVQRKAFGRQLPIVVMPEGSSPALIAQALATHPKRCLWRQVSRPVHGGAVEMTSVKTPLHCGVWLDLDGGVVLHCAAGVGVSIDSMLRLKTLGWGAFRHFEYCGDQPPGGALAQAAA